MGIWEEVEKMQSYNEGYNLFLTGFALSDCLTFQSRVGFLAAYDSNVGTGDVR